MSGSSRRTLDLSDDVSATVDEAVRSGEFENASAVVETALREWQERRENFGYSIEELQALWKEGLNSGPSQPLTDAVFEDVKRRGRERLAAWRDGQK